MMRAAAFIGLATAVAIGWMLLVPAVPVAQPFAFNHARHGDMACVTCHRGALRQQRATLPPLALCDKCHATEPTAAARVVWSEPRRESVPWVRVNRVPDHAMFSHRRHAGLGRLDCRACHGDVAQLTAPPPRPFVRLDMEGCLSCHRQENASQECAACHR